MEEKNKDKKIANNNDTDSKRTIKEVFDVKEGKFIDADDFFKRDEAEIMAFRRHLEEAITLNEPRFICPYCKQMVKICGRQTSNHKAVYFSHLYDSDDCEIKTTTQLSADYINAKKYGMIQESERHKRLKNLLAKYLQTERCKKLGFSNVQVSKRINSNIPYLNWRCPDVCVEFNGKKIVFELQLSTYFISILVARDIFYRLNGYYIIWVFNFDNNYISQESLFTKDTYYANKRNVFIFDNEALKRSEEEDMLYLSARYLDNNNNLSDAQLISMFDLKFDETTYKPYFYNAETEYYNLHPEISERIKKLERTTEDYHLGLMKRQQEEEENKKLLEEKAAQMREHMKEYGGVAILYKKGRRFGYKYDSIQLTEPKYTFAEDINEKGLAIVKSNNRFGIVNQYGEEIMSCVCKDIYNLGNGAYLVNSNREWSIWNSGITLGKSKAGDEVMIFNITKKISAFNIIRDSTCIYSMVLNGNATRYINCFFVSNDSDNLYTINHGLAHEQYITNKGHIISDKETLNDNVIIANNYFKNQLYGLLNNEYNPISAFKYTSIDFIAENTAKVKPIDIFDINSNYSQRYKELASCIVKSKDKFGIIAYSNLSQRYRELVPCIYDGIQPINNSYYLVKNDGLYGIIETTDIDRINLSWINCYGFRNTKFIEIVPCKYEWINLLQNEYYTVNKGGKLGLIKIEPYNARNNNLSSVVIPCNYESIQYLSDKYFAVRTKSKYGVVNCSNETIIQPAYDSIKLSDDDTFYVKSEGKTGHFDSNGNVLIDTIATINDTYTIGCFWGDFGIITADRSIALSFKYNDIHCLNEYMIVAIYREIVESDRYYGNQYVEHIELYDYNLNRILGDYDIASINPKDNRNFMIKLIDGSTAQLTSTGTLIKNNVSEISDKLMKYNLFGHWGIIDLSGNCVQPNIWDSISVLENKNILVSKSDEVCVLSPDGQVVVTVGGKTFGSMLTKDIIKLIDSNANKSHPSYLCQQGYTFDLYTTAGECICEKCSNTTTNDDGSILYQCTNESGKRYGLISQVGERLLPNEYKSINFSIKDLIIAYGEDIVIVYGKNYRQRFEYQGLEILNDKLIAAKPNNGDSKWGIVNSNWKFVLRPIFDRVSRLSDKWILLEYNEKFGCISSDFKSIYPCRFFNIMVDRNEQPLFFSNNKWILCSKYMAPNRLEVNATYTGEVVKILPFGIVLKMPNNDSILVHISEIQKRGRTIDSYDLNDLVNIRVLSYNITTAKYRIKLL